MNRTWTAHTILLIFTLIAGQIGSAKSNDLLTVEKIFIPQSFDTNDSVEIWFYGFLNTPCSQIDGVKIVTDVKAREIILEPQISAAVQETASCPTVIKPVFQNVQLGQLQAGEYSILMEGVLGDTREGTLLISPTNREDVDEFMYAPVEFIEAKVGIDKIRMYGRYPLMLIGCAFLDEVQIDWDAEDLVVIRPILSIGNDRECDTHEIEFEWDVDLTYPLPENSLIHVRTINGTSNSKFVSDAKVL